MRLSQRQPDRADARADVDDPALPSVAAAATSSAASVPTRWPRFGWTSVSRPPSHRSSVNPSALAALPSSVDGSAIEQFFSQTRFDNEAASPPFLVLVDQNPPRQKAERPLGGGHVLVGHEIGDPLRLQDRFR